MLYTSNHNVIHGHPIMVSCASCHVREFIWIHGELKSTTIVRSPAELQTLVLSGLSEDARASGQLSVLLWVPYLGTSWDRTRLLCLTPLDITSSCH